MEDKDKGLRFNEGKVRLDLIPSSAIEAIGKVLTKGAEKYSERNWEKGMKWSKVIASLKRHLLAFEKGEDIDPESGELHLSHVLTNTAFLIEYMETFPEKDDRVKPVPKRVGLDIDGVLADFRLSFCKKYSIPLRDNWHFTYKYRDLYDKLKTDEEFWMNIEPIGNELNFEPVCYVTNRICSNTITEAWVEKHGFPCVEIHQAGESKVEALRMHNIEVFVDDNIDNYYQIDKEDGIACYLFDQPYNRKYNVGYKRITNLKDLL